MSRVAVGRQTVTHGRQNVTRTAKRQSGGKTSVGRNSSPDCHIEKKQKRTVQSIFPITSEPSADEAPTFEKLIGERVSGAFIDTEIMSPFSGVSSAL